MSAPFRDDPPPSCHEALVPLLCRRISLEYYRRTARPAQRRARVGPDEAPAVPALEDVLAVYLVQRLPARAVARLGERGIMKVARPLAALLGAGLVLLLALGRLIEVGWGLARRAVGLGANASPGPDASLAEPVVPAGTEPPAGAVDA